ncbi:MAG: FG-GAP-like repeat-containing protein [Candidatus Kerfeldbacteria bacterium]
MSRKKILKSILHFVKVSVYMVVMFTMTFSYSFIGAPQADAVTTGTITGRIMAGGSPVDIGDVGLNLVNAPGVDPVGTNPDGTFTFIDVPVSYYQLDTHINDTVALAGYMNISVSNIEVTAGQTTDVGDIALTQATKTITGTVTRQGTGTAVVDAQISAFPFEGMGSGVNATTDSNGDYTLYLTGGKWGLNVSGGYDEEHNPIPVDWIYSGMPQDQNFADDNTVESRVANFEVVTANSFVNGKIVYPNGTPKNDLNIDLFSFSGGGAFGRTDSSGNFTIRTAAGNFELSAWFPHDEQQYSLPRQQISVVANQTLNLGTIYIVEKTSQIKGVVKTSTGIPVENVNVSAFSMMGSGPGDNAWTQTAADGSYSLYVTSGMWGVDVQTNPESVWVPDGTQKQYQVAENQIISNANFTLIKADVTINGRIVNTQGVLQSDFFGYANVMDQDMQFGPGPGKFFGGQIGGGTFQIKIPSQVMTKIMVTTFVEPGSPYSIQEDITLTVAPNGTYDVELVLVPNDAVLTGTVKDQKGNVISGFEFGDVFVMGEKGQWNNAFINPDGTYTMSLRSGTYDGRGAFIRGGGYIDKPPQFEDGGVVIKPGTTIWNPVVYKADAKINVTIKDPDGNLLGGFGFAFAHEDFEGDPGIGFKDSMEAGGEILGGKGSINVVGGKTYLVGAPPPPKYDSENWMSPEEQEVFVAANGTASVVLQYKKADGVIKGTVTFEDGSPIPFGFISGWSENGANSGTPNFGSTFSLPVTKNGIWHINADTFSGSEYFTSGETVIKTPDSTGFVVERNFVLSKSDFLFPEPKCATWDSTQPKVINLSDGTSLTFPARSLATSGNVTVCAQPTVNLKPEKTKKPAKGFGYTLTATDSSNQTISTFNSAVTISMKVEADKLAELGITTDDLLPAFFNTTTNKWDTVNNATYDAVNDLLSFTTTHFTDYAIVTGVTITGSGPVASDIIASPANNGGPHVTVWDYEGNIKTNFFAYPSNLRMSIQTGVGDFDGDGINEIVTIPGEGFAPQVRVFNLEGQLVDQFFAYQTHLRSGYNMVVADIDGDGSDEIITAPMAGEAPHVRIFNGKGEVENQFFAYDEMFKGGVNLTTGDVDGDGNIEIITAPASGGSPDIRIFNSDGSQVTGFWAYSSALRGGFDVSTGDLNGDSVVDILVTPGEGFGPQIAMFTGDGTLIGRFMAFADTFKGGINAVVGDVTGDSQSNIIVTPLSNGGPQVRVFDYQGNHVSQFWAYASTLRGSFVPLISDIDQDGTNEIVIAPGNGFGPHLRAFEYDGTITSSFFTHNEGYRGGINLMSIPTF